MSIFIELFIAVGIIAILYIGHIFFLYMKIDWSQPPNNKEPIDYPVTDKINFKQFSWWKE